MGKYALPAGGWALTFFLNTCKIKKKIFFAWHLDTVLLLSDTSQILRNFPLYNMYRLKQLRYICSIVFSITFVSRYAMKCLDKKRIKMKQGETLALNERIMLSLVSTGVSIPFWALLVSVCMGGLVFYIRIIYLRYRHSFPAHYAASQFLGGLEFLAGKSSTKLI